MYMLLILFVTISQQVFYLLLLKKAVILDLALAQKIGARTSSSFVVFIGKYSHIH